MTRTHPTHPHHGRRLGVGTRIVVGLGVGAVIGGLSVTAASAQSPFQTSAVTATTEQAPLVGAASAGDAVAGQYIVVLKDANGLSAAGLHAAAAAAPSTLVSDAAARARKAGATVLDQYTNALQGYSATLSPPALAKVRADSAVDYVQVNQKYRATTTENSPPWGLARIDQRNLPIQPKYYYTGTGLGVTAYVVDTGIRSTHLDFTTDVAGNAVPSRVSGGISTLPGAGSTADCAGHGTHVSGTIGGEHYGVAKQVHLVPVRVLDCNGEGSTSTVLAGLNWVITDHVSGPAVVNMSLTTSSASVDKAIDTAVGRVITDGVSVVVAAGNGNSKGQGVSACTYSPSDVRAAITVGATSAADRRAAFSNFGSCVDLYAPGVNINSDWDTADNAIAQLSGTSMATPHVTGAVVLYLQQHPLASPATVQKAIIAAATPNKVLNVSASWPRRLLFAVQPVKAPPATTTPGQITSGTALLKGKTICSPNTLYCLSQRASDGRLVLQKPGSRTIWSAAVGGASWTKMNVSGDLVSYDIYNRAIWSTGTGGGPATLSVGDNGNLSIVNNASGTLEWTSRSTQKKALAQAKSGLSILFGGSALYRGGHKMVSPDGRFSLGLRVNGALVLAKKGKGTIWHTSPLDDDWLTLRADGNLLLYRSDGKILWQTGTGGMGADRLTLKSTGNLTLTRISDKKILWQTKTTGA